MNATALELLAYSSLYSAMMLSSWSNGSRFNIVRLKICSTSERLAERWRRPFHDGDQYVNRDRDPDLNLDCVFRGAEEHFDLKMPFAPFEKRFDLPSAAMEIAGRAKLLVRNTSRRPVVGSLNL